MLTNVDFFVQKVVHNIMYRAER